ncbi:TIGR03663 family protein [bacterium]|nr:TIGR03663 family protein [bacterium]
MENISQQEKNNWLDKPIKSIIPFNTQTLIFIGVLILAIFTRLYLLGARVMSHDEINHVYFAYNFFKGGDYVHNPVTHGPLQFHLLELSYFLFNASDFSARIPAAFFSIISILFIWKYKRYLGRYGAIAASILFVISPYMLYYGRYARNEAIAIFFSLATAWSILRYLDTGKNKYIYLTAAFTSLHFTTKETAFIFTAEIMLFLGFLFLYRISKFTWKQNNLRKIFFILILISLLFLGASLVFHQIFSQNAATEELVDLPSKGLSPDLLAVGAALVTFVIAFVLLIVGYGWKKLTQERTFGMILFQLTLVIPQLAAFPAFWLKLPTTEYTNIDVLTRISLIMVVFLVISIILGGLWNQKAWLVGAGIYYAIFIVFYTSIFANPGGIYSGLIGSLGYWLEQQGVQRGNQPWYYFILVQLPIYEYLAVIGTAITGILSLRWVAKRKNQPEMENLLMEDEETGQLSVGNSRKIAIAMMLTLSVISIFAYMLAGEKMPWLTVHISWTMWLVTGWLIGKLIETIHWPQINRLRGITVALSVTAIFVFIFYGASLWLKPISPFSGKELENLTVTGTFLMTLLTIGGLIYVVFRLTKKWIPGQLNRFVLLTVLVALAGLTTRHAFMASYQNYDLANEYLVYAHSARGPKDALEEIESISKRISGDKQIMIAIDNHTAYPFWWYLRDYPNKLEYGENPTRDLRNYPIVLAGDANYTQLEPIIKGDYLEFEYVRMIWPNQDYFNLSFYTNYLANPETRKGMLNALFQVWLNRDFTAYGEVTGQDVSNRYWNPSQDFKMYVRKDVAAQIWQFGTTAESYDLTTDPYADGQIDLQPAVTLSDLNLSGAKGIAVAPDNSLYVADTGNNRILHIGTDYQILNAWGTEGSEPGQFNQPWGITVDPDSFVYVTDTWNHRVQKFTAEGAFITTWGTYGLTDATDTFWGPRGIAVNNQGNILITDTGNKRVLVFNSDGEFIQEFGTTGYQLGEFDEPVGLAVSPIDNTLFVADTWNQRIQAFDYQSGYGYSPAYTWDIDGWYGQSLENKPFITADTLNRVLVADPEAGRVLVFANDGTFLSTFGDYDLLGENGFGLIGGLAADNLGGVWVTDSLKNEIKYFSVP